MYGQYVCKASWLSLILLATALATTSAAARHGADKGSRLPAASQGDSRIRVVLYSADRIYRLRGYAGYQIDVQFSAGEHFEGAGVGDAKAVALGSAGNHLFIKPRSAHVATDVTVLTNRRTYLFDYTASPGPPERADPDVIFALRFEYPRSQMRAGATAWRDARVAGDLARAQRHSPRNRDYWYCGAPSLKPVAAWDDGVETHLVFGSRAQLPAVFVRNADGSESLVNFNMRGADMIIHRIARRFVLRRGKLTGCIVNRGYAGSGRRLLSGTISRRVWRQIRPAPLAREHAARDAETAQGGRP